MVATKYQKKKPLVKYQTLAQNIETIVGPFLPRPLMSARALDSLARTVEFLPANATNGFGFECQMAGSSHDADFFFRVPPETPGAEYLATISRFVDTESNPRWLRIEQYCSAWISNADELRTKVAHIWFEFDITHEPVVFAEPSILFWHSPKEISAANDFRLQGELLRDSWNLLCTNPLTDGSQDNFLRCIKALPPGTFVFCVGVMIARPELEIRLCLKGIEGGAIAPYLRTIGWEGNFEVAEELIAEIDKLADRFQLILGIGEGTGEAISPRLHLEIRCDESFKPNALARWQKLLNHLIGVGLASRERAEALLAWPGFPFEELQPDLSHSLYARIIDHVKIVIEPDGSLNCKCYFGVWETVRAGMTT